ncbi:MAG: LOG family protein [Patescibacteria group bacterium]
MTNKKVTIFGFSEAKLEDQEYQLALESAKLLAQNGFTIVNGGGPGIMRASTEGAKLAGGKTIGVTFDPKGMTFFEGQDSGNSTDEKIVTPDYFSRTMKLLELGDVYLFFNGGTGTVSEFGMAWGLARLFFGHHKPLILFGSWWHEVMEAFGENMHLRQQELLVYHIVDSPEEVMQKVLDLTTA